MLGLVLLEGSNLDQLSPASRTTFRFYSSSNGTVISAEPCFTILVVLDPFSEILRQVLNLDIQGLPI